MSRVCSQSCVHPNDVSPTKERVVIPYIRGLSEGIQRVLSRVNIRVVFWPHTTLKTGNLSDPRTLHHYILSRVNVVYCIPCTKCQEVYIRQTSRSLEEHKAAVRYAKTEASTVAEHVWERGHQMDFVLAQQPNSHQRCMLESWFIQRQPTLNREAGCLAPVYSRSVIFLILFVTHFYFYSIFVCVCVFSIVTFVYLSLLHVCFLVLSCHLVFLSIPELLPCRLIIFCIPELINSCVFAFVFCTCQ